MRIAVSSQNFRTITGHAGKSRRFILYDAGDSGITEVGRLDLPKSSSIHEYRGTDHPLFALDVVVTGGCGEGFIRRLAAHGVQVITTAEPDPLVAATAVAAGTALPPALPHEH